MRERVALARSGVMRTLVYIIVGIFVITFIRMVVGIIMRGFSDLRQAENPTAKAGAPKAPAGGHLMRDPVCGTYVAEQAAVRKQVGTEVMYFCSAACRDKFAG